MVKAAAASVRAATCLVVAALSAPLLAQQADQRASSFGDVYRDNCAVCHGEDLRGAAQGTPLAGQPLIHGETMQALVQSIANGFPDKGMPAWSEVFSEQQIKSLALYISEVRDGMLYDDFRIHSELTLPTQTFKTSAYDLRVIPVAADLDPLPYSLAVLPDGDMLVTEKMRGLRIVHPDGTRSDLVAGTPAVYDDARDTRVGLQYGSGWLLDVALHPDYERNGWIYIAHTDRCADCNAASRQYQRPVSMNRLIRGRIRDGQWVDEQVIWQADIESYSPSTDVAAGGRIAFDPEGFVFMSVGMKSMDGLQDLGSPHGKILRLRDDGGIPTDNPFVGQQGVLPAIWSYGHRSPQGLEFDPVARQLWGTEHGPRGGDEVNLLKPGRNFGWPLYSKGQNYDGTEVNWGAEHGIEFELKDIEQPVVDFTPSPAISSFVIYQGDAFPEWRGDFIVGSLKASDIFRLRIRDNKLVEKELIVPDLARVRDIEIADNGELLVLLEHSSGGQVVRIAPDNPKQQDEEWTSLFNGRDLSGWTPKIRGHEFGEDPQRTFRVQDGAITVSYENYTEFASQFGHLFYRSPFSHYRLRLQYRFIGDQAPGGEAWAFRNSGVMLHCQDPATMPAGQDFPISVEAQFLGGRGDGSMRPTANMCSPGTHVVYRGEFTDTHCIPADAPTIDGDEWVQFEVLVREDELVRHFVNGRKVIEYGGLTTGGGVVSGHRPDMKPEGAPLKSGYISLQSESHPIQFRNIELLNLSG